MKNVRFDEIGNTPVFAFENHDGVKDWIEYKPSVKGLWPSLRKEDFSVELLVNPVLNRARNVYNIQKKDGGIERVGMVFPVSALDSEDCFEQTGSGNYAFIAFQTLLERLDNIENTDQDFSNNFEDNICVCVFNLKHLGIANPLHLCINSLRKYGYSYFEPKNEIKEVKGYKPDLYVNRNANNIKVYFKEPKSYSNPVIDLMLRALPHAHNIIHRFVLMYQIIEIMMEEVTLKKINEEIEKLQKQKIPHNDFLDTLKRFGGEKERIKEIFEICKLSKDEFSWFKESCKHLYGIIGYDPDDKSDYMYFYSFRNQMTHTFRNLHDYPEEVAETVQGFEKVIMTILEKYE